MNRVGFLVLLCLFLVLSVRAAGAFSLERRSSTCRVREACDLWIRGNDEQFMILSGPELRVFPRSFVIRRGVRRVLLVCERPGTGELRICAASTREPERRPGEQVLKSAFCLRLGVTCR